MTIAKPKALTVMGLTSREMAGLSPAGLARYASRGQWQLAPHLKELNYYLMLLAGRHITRLLVEMPPRHGKSILSSHYFPAWYLGRFPDHSVMLASYESTFAQGWGRRTRDTLLQFGPEVFGVQLDPRSAASDWRLTGHQGSMNTAGVGGAITGKGSSCLVIDDPVKNAEQAHSPTYRERAWEWYKSTAYTRLEPGGVIVLIQTRWHEDDLAGRILQETQDGGEPWTVLRYPALAEENDPLGRELDEPLWAERFDRERLLEIKQTLGAYWWAALYQQRPSPQEGAVFQRQHFRYFRVADSAYSLMTDQGAKRVLPDDCWLFATVDTAQTIRESSDYTVIGVWAATKERDLLLLDLIRVRLESPNITPLIRQAYEKWRPSYISVEGKSVYQEARKAGLPVRELIADKDKWTRAQPVSARIEAGTVYFLAGAPWLHDLEQELLAFPNAAHDDQVDALSYAGIEISKRRLSGDSGFTV